MSHAGFIRAVLLSLVCVAGSAGFAGADIYSYTDANGVIHFTNVRKSDRCKLYLASKPKRPILYLQNYDEVIRKAGRRYGVECSLIKAVIKAESDFNHLAVSRKGAQGLMQLMPATAKDMEVRNPFNPTQNIYGGTRYLAFLLKRFNDNKVLALAAYNAGPETVEQHRGVPPYSETRGYIQKVLRYYRSYGQQ